MAAAPLRRRVLIVEGEPSIRNVLYVLLAGLGCDGEVASDGQQALSMLERQRFDAVLLDLRATHLRAGEMVATITDLRPSLVGRILVITGEVADPATIEELTRCAVPHLELRNVASDLWNRLRSLPGFSPSTPKPAVR